MDENYQQLVEGLEPRTELVRSVQEAQRVQARLAQLPMADPQRAIRELGLIVDVMLCQQWDGVERTRVLQSLAAPLQALADGVDAAIVAESHPLPRSKVELAAAMLVLRQRLGQCWCLAVHEMCAPTGKIPMLKRRRLTLALNHAAAHLGAALMLAYQLHRTPPAGLWQRVHALYRFASAHRVHHGSVADPNHGRGRDLQDRYAGSILLAMANPYGFQQRELLDVAAAVRALAAQVEFHADGGGTVLVACAGADSGPGYLPQDRESPGQGDLALDVRRVLETVAENIEWTPPDVDAVSLREAHGGSVLIHRGMLQRVVRSWQGTVDRGYQRMPAGHTLLTVLGLHAVHRVFAEGRSFEAFQRQLSGGEIELGSGSTAASWVAGAVDGQATRPCQAQVLDQSLGGYRLSWSPEQRVRMKIGDMIALAPEEDSEAGADTAWLLGLVRWLRGDGDGGFEVGVELLAKHAFAAAVRSIDRRGERSPMQRALLLADEDGDGGGDAGTKLVVPHLFDRHATELEWSTSGDPNQGQPAVQGARCAIAARDSLSTAYYRVSLLASSSK